jgi:hypothetical protein
MHEPVESGRGRSPGSPKSAGLIFNMDGKEAREGRVGNAFACERCRKHKVRCVPSDTSGTCQRYVFGMYGAPFGLTIRRCQKARVDCVEHVARRKPAKSRYDDQPTCLSRDFSKKLDKLSAMVATMAPAPQPDLPPVAPLPSQVPEAPRQNFQSAHASSASAPTILNTPILPASGPVNEPPMSFWESTNNTLSCFSRLDPLLRSISFADMQMLINTYRHMVDFFPFVTLPETCTVREMSENRPVLMFALCTVASYDTMQLQQTLSREFRKVALVKIMNGEKSLDLLQGLLVFIAWHQHYMDAQAISVHMLLQICVAIASDLGLDKLSAKARSPLHKEDPGDREAKRAYLGCYYLAINIGLLAPGRSRCISYSTTLRSYSSDLASAAWEHKTDAVLPILIDVCQFMEDVEETFQERSEHARAMRAQLKRLSDKWDNLRSASKLQASDYSKSPSIFKSLAYINTGTLSWIQLTAQIYLYKTAATIELIDPESTPSAPSFQLNLRATCLRSIEQFLDNSMRLLTTQYDMVSLVDYLNLISAVTGLGRLALHSSPLPGWDPVELQIAGLFNFFCDQISSLMPRSRGSSENKENLFERFRRITSMMKLALRTTPGGSPHGGTFELATGSGRTVSLLQDVSLPKIDGATNGAETLPSLRKINPSLDLNDGEFHWKFLMGTV